MNQTEIIVKTYAIGFSVVQVHDYHLAPTYFYAHPKLDLNWITTIYPKPDGSFDTYQQELVNYLNFYKHCPMVIIGSDLSTLSAIPSELYAHQYILTLEELSEEPHQTQLSEDLTNLEANSLCFIDTRMLESLNIDHLCSLIAKGLIKTLVFGYYSHRKDPQHSVQDKMISLIQSLATN